MIWSHVTGSRAGLIPAAWATDFRNHSSCVLAQNGAPISRPFQVPDSIGPERAPAVSSWASASVYGRRNPASANSGMNGGSRLMRSIDASLAARRRTSCSRCDVASLGRTDVSMR